MNSLLYFCCTISINKLSSTEHAQFGAGLRVLSQVSQYGKSKAEGGTQQKGFYGLPQAES